MKINEITAFGADPEDKEFFEELWTDCQPYLKDIDYKPTEFPLYRGMTGEPSQLGGIKRVRLDNRRPKDTTPKDHAELNDYFQKNYRHPYRNGLFATSVKGIAGAYGSAQAIFPVGAYECIWSPDITDLYSHIIDYTDFAYENWNEYRGYLGLDQDDFWDKVEKGQITAVNVLRFREDYHDAGYIQGKIKAGIHSNNEIMIWCESYYYIPPDGLMPLHSFINKKLSES